MTCAGFISWEIKAESQLCPTPAVAGMSSSSLLLVPFLLSLLADLLSTDEAIRLSSAGKIWADDHASLLLSYYIAG